MMARIRRQMAKQDNGFTLIELLIVMIIIGILAAIAIPVFLNQRQAAHESAIKSDLRTAANQIETEFVANQAYPADAAGEAIVDGIRGSAGVQLTYHLNADGSYCIDGSSPNAGHTWSFHSNDRGLGDANETCAARP